MRKTAGRFNTQTQTRISTEHGTILKVMMYLDDGVLIDYRIRPKCSLCGGNVGCVCYNEDNSDAPFKEAFTSLMKEWICEKSVCIVNYVKTDDPEYYQDLFEKNKGDVDNMALNISDDVDCDMEDGEFCQT